MHRLRPACGPIACLLLLSACAAPPKVQTVQAGDAALDCMALRKELASAEQLHAQADKDSGMSFTNAMLAFLFLPAAVKSMTDSQEAAVAAQQRKEYLSGLIEWRRCGPARLQPASATAPVPASPGS